LRRANQLAAATVEAEALERTALGLANAVRTKAAADQYAQECAAKGILATMDAQSTGLAKMVRSSGGSVAHLTNYLMVERNMYQPLAEANAKALQGLNPKYTIWQRGEGKDQDPIQSALATLPHYLDAIKKQTGYTMLDKFFTPPSSSAPAAPAAAVAASFAATSQYVDSAGPVVQNVDSTRLEEIRRHLESIKGLTLTVTLEILEKYLSSSELLMIKHSINSEVIDGKVHYNIHELLGVFRKKL